MTKLHQIGGCGAATRKADVLFIHGLGGDAFITWRYGKNVTTSWPHWLSKDFPDIGVWSLGYPASPTRWARICNLPILRGLLQGSPDSGHTMALPDRATQVLDLMVQQGFGRVSTAFVCHSLGGLLAKQILRKASEATDSERRAIFSHTRAVLFIATPHAGAQLASLANAFRKAFGATVSIEDLRAHDAHLRDLFDWYRNQAPNAGIRTATLYERRNLKGACIVNPTSAHPGTGDDPIPLDEDHISISKPGSRDHQACGVLRRLLNDHVLSITPEPAKKPGPSPPSSLASGTDGLPLQAFQNEVTLIQPAFLQSGRVSQLASIIQIGQVLPIQLGLDRSAEVEDLQQQLHTKDEQIDQKDQQIASLHRILEKAIETTAGAPTGAATEGTPGSAGPGPATIYEEKAADCVRLLDDLVEMDFPRASEAVAQLEPWVESNEPRLSKISLAKLYHLFFRVEITRVRRSLPGSDLAKAQRFLRKAADALR
jgi:pimeloyl-ACP methyl ester carboxylesterase